MTYLLTFCCYGTHLPGDERGWVERVRGDHRGGLRDSIPALAHHASEMMTHAKYTMSRRDGEVVLQVLLEVASVRGWRLVAAHVRVTHVHCVVGDLDDPNRAIGDFKAYASRSLNQMDGHRKRWAREGSTRGLRNDSAIRAAVRYVVEGQGEPMAVYESPL